MVEISFGLAVSAFIAGILMFLAPCTLPLVPAYLAFISGVKNKDLQTSKEKKRALRKIRINALAFILGFSFVFISFGVLAGFFGSFIGQFRVLLGQVGGAFIIIFALMMLQVVKVTSLTSEHKLKLPDSVKPGNPVSAALIGVTFALGWTPCVGPVLASVLLLATTSTTVLSGALLLGIFSLGLALPFLAVAILYGSAQEFVSKYSFVSSGVNFVGGLFLLLIGILVLTNNFGLTVEYGYKVFNQIGIEGIFDHF